MANKASLAEFNEQRNKLPGDRKDIAAVGSYVLELYYDPLGQQPKSIIEVNKLKDSGDYEKVTSINFNPDTASERTFEDPEAAARDEFNTLKNSISQIEDYL